MPNDAQVRALRQGSNTLVDAAMRAVRHVWAETQGMPPEAVRDAFLDVLPEVVDVYGNATAELAAEFFEQTTGMTVEPAQVTTADAIRAQTRYRAGHLFTDGDFISALALDVDKFVKMPGRQTVYDGSRSHGLRYARVPSGAKTCAFCLMLAGRDAVYSSKRAAGERGSGNEYHGGCDCQAVAIRTDDDYPESYQPGELAEMYELARDSADGNGAKDIAAEMRRMFPDSVTDALA